MFLAIEFAQGQLGGPVDDATFDAASWWIRVHALARWPRLPMTFPMHSELASGQADGKTDLAPRGSPEANEFRMRLLARL